MILKLDSLRKDPEISDDGKTYTDKQGRQRLPRAERNEANHSTSRC